MARAAVLSRHAVKTVSGASALEAGERRGISDDCAREAQCIIRGARQPAKLAIGVSSSSRREATRLREVAMGRRTADHFDVTRA